MARSHRLALSLRLLLAACALVAGLDVHLLEFSALPSRAEIAAATQGTGPQIHASDCPHREHVPPVHNAHDCMLCKSGAARAASLQPAAATQLVAQQITQRVADAQPLAATTCTTGTLGARGPPGTHA